MQDAHRVALEGFSDFEQRALAACFRVPRPHGPRYTIAADTADAEYLVADADDARALAAVARSGRTGDTVFVGAAPPAGATAWTMRPIDPTHVLRELDALVTLRASARLPTPMQLLPPGRWPSRPSVAPPPGRTVPLRRASDLHRPPAAPEPRRATSALLVGDLPPAAPAMQGQLERLGLRTERVATGEQALQRLAGARYDLVVVEPARGADATELDGLVLCQRIKRHAGLPGLAPAVVVLAERPSELARARGSLAGCDALVAAPADEHELARVLAPLGLHPS